MMSKHGTLGMMVAFLVLATGTGLSAQASLDELTYRCGFPRNGIRTITFGYKRGFFLNAHGLPTFRVYAEMKSLADNDSYRIGKRSCFHVGDAYYIVSDIYRRNERRGEKGHLTLTRIEGKPKGLYVSNTDRK